MSNKYYLNRYGSICIHGGNTLGLTSLEVCDLLNEFSNQWILNKDYIGKFKDGREILCKHINGLSHIMKFDVGKWKGIDFTGGEFYWKDNDVIGMKEYFGD